MESPHLKIVQRFISCVSKINNALIDNEEDFDVATPKYNLIEYSKNYTKTTWSLWYHYSDEPKSGINNGIDYYIRD